MSSKLLPANSTPLEKAVADTTTPPPGVISGADAIATAKHVTRPPSFLQFLHHEYGLAELSPYLANPYTLIDQGREWQLLRGTMPAIDLALSWLGVSASLEEAYRLRRFWNSFSLMLSQLPTEDLPLLARIEGLADLSSPQRSRFKRGVHGYDARALEADRGRLDRSQLDFDSGIRVTGGTKNYPEGAKWSFGRSHEFSHTYSQAEGEALGNWIDETDEPINWLDIVWPWMDWDVAWLAEPAVTRAAFLTGWFLGRRLYLKLVDGDDNVIGYRRCRSVHRVRPAHGGAIKFAGNAYQPGAGAQLYIEAMTQFGDANGITARTSSLLVSPTLSEGIPPGRLWLGPNDLTGGTEIAPFEINVPMRRTVRDRFKLLVNF